MALKKHKGDNQKLKMLYLKKIFSEETDDLNSLTISEIISKLSAYGVNADRKTLYLDFEELRNYGMDIITVKKGRHWYYHLGERDFELPEVKLLVDSVQSAKFITDKKSKQLIKKLEALVSNHEAKMLHRQVLLSGRVKTMNESIYYNVDKIHQAISLKCQIQFKYFQWNVQKKMELRKDGAWYQISPWLLTCNNENYYLAGYDEEEDKIKHYRVDKMKDIIITDKVRIGQKQFSAINAALYTRSLFGMYSGTETAVTLEAQNDMANVLIDRFGRNINIVPINETHFKTTVNIAVSNQFFGWIMALGTKVKITAPDTTVKQMKDNIQILSEQYSAQK